MRRMGEDMAVWLAKLFQRVAGYFIARAEKQRRAR